MQDQYSPDFDDSEDDTWPYGYGICHCGCGQQTRIAPRNRAEYGWVKGGPRQYVLGHNKMEDFWSKVDRRGPDDCWPWMGYVNKHYGEVMVRRERLRAHRVAYALACGDIPDGMMVRHLCNNTTCCNPAHLAVGTHQDNMDDRDLADRTAKGEGHGSHILTEQQVLEIYARCRAEDEEHEEIAVDYGVQPSTISSISCGKTWGWLTGHR